MKNLIYLLGFILFSITLSCESEIVDQINEEEDNETINDFNQFSGEWLVSAYNDSELLFGPFKVATLKEESLTKNDSITILDIEEEFWKFQVKASIKKEGTNAAFQTELSNCEKSDVGIGIKISNGQILNSDSIYFEIQFEDEETPYGYTYQLKGHRIIK